MTPRKKRPKLKCHPSNDDDDRRPAAVETEDDKDEKKEDADATEDEDEDDEDYDPFENHRKNRKKNYVPTCLHSDDSASMEGSTRRHIDNVIKHTKNHYGQARQHWEKYDGTPCCLGGCESQTDTMWNQRQ